MDNSELSRNFNKTAKIELIHAYLSEKFSTLYKPDRDISIDESMES